MWEEEVENRQLDDGQTYSGDRFWPLPANKPDLG
jgi:hypothetical protein